MLETSFSCGLRDPIYLLSQCLRRSSEKFLVIQTTGGSRCDEILTSASTLAPSHLRGYLWSWDLQGPHEWFRSRAQRHCLRSCHKPSQGRVWRPKSERAFLVWILNDVMTFKDICGKLSRTNVTVESRESYCSHEHKPPRVPDKLAADCPQPEVESSTSTRSGHPFPSPNPVLSAPVPVSSTSPSPPFIPTQGPRKNVSPRPCQLVSGRRPFSKPIDVTPISNLGPGNRTAQHSHPPLTSSNVRPLPRTNTKPNLTTPENRRGLRNRRPSPFLRS
ncbi:hypothetical protein EDB92DRAFT_374109 [Lactarius akahatsu]|uniref:Uncharacterized protein n=1 Tax=Lactarius akahatsu TaxID=416441 RepID=A0AAD4Q942_9AGAM|nr:hypothetical protein EDB92DRAFT_374109 [Lactarius akahatsu]